MARSDPASAGSLLVPAPVGRLAIERFEPLIGEQAYRRLCERFARGRELLGDHVMWHVNSTARGGGVAEMLYSLLAYGRGAGVDQRWLAIAGTEPFFAVTKRLHNNLHGAPGDGLPLDDERDYRLPLWAGILPLETKSRQPIPDDK